jgi:hypothetical protein
VSVRRRTVLLACTLSSVVGVAAAPAAAHPTLGFASSSVLASNADASADVSSGSHPFALTTTFQLNTTLDSEGRLISEGGDLKDVVLELPPGLAIDPLATPRCDAEAFASINATTGEDGCPNASAVGVVAMENVAPDKLTERKVSDFPLYDLVAPAGVPAQFGFDVAGVAVYLTATVRTGGDYGLTVTMAGIPQAAHVLGSAVTLWGVPAESAHDPERGDCVESHGACPAGVAPAPLVTLPGQCTTGPTTSLRADSWQEAGQFTALASDPLTAGGAPLTACGALGFGPLFHAQVEAAATDTPTGLKLDVQLPQNEEPSGLGEADLEEALIVLPPGMRLNLSRAGALVGCPLEGAEGIDLSSSEPGHCPAASKIGSVSVTTPLVAEALQGGIYLAQQGNLAGNGTNPFGSLLALYLVAEGSGVTLKLPVEVVANPETGQLTLHLGPDPLTGQAFAPQLPLAELEMAFSGSQQAVLVTPATCGSYTTTASLTPWSGAAPTMLSEAASLVTGCTDAFNPSVSANAANTQALGYTPVAITLARQDGEQELKSVSTTFPEGMLATIGNVVPCPEPQASLGTCGAESLLGETSISVGTGPEPFVIKGGEVYFTGPYGGGPFGLSIVMPTAVGPLNLGPAGHPIVVRAAIHVNKLTGQTTVGTDTAGAYAIPSVLQGVVLQIRSLSIVVNRPQFDFNPSGCGPHSFTSTITSTQGTTTSVSQPYTPTGCAALPFGPKLTSSTIGRPSRADGVGFYVKVVEGYPNESNAHSVKVELPKQLAVRVTTLHHACLAKVFEENPASCPPESVVGTVNTVTTALPVPLVGPAYFVSYGSAKFPELVLVLQGDGVTIEAYGETYISPSGISSSTFPDLPDAPVPSFEMTLPAGPDSALAANGNLCEKILRTPTVSVAENGLTVKEDPPIKVSDCPPVLKVVRHSVRGSVATVVVSVPSAGKLVVGGKGLSSATKRVGQAGKVTVKLTPAKRERRFLAHHRRRSLKVALKVLFLPSHGLGLSTHLTVRLR